MSFVWHLTPSKSIELCSGYFRIILNGRNGDVDDSIHKLCHEYYKEKTIPNFITRSYQYSPIFTHFGLKWLFKFCSSGVFEIIVPTLTDRQLSRPFNISLVVSSLYSRKSIKKQNVMLMNGRSQLTLFFPAKYQDPQFIINIDMLKDQRYSPYKNIKTTNQTMKGQYIWNISPRDIIYHNKQTLCKSPVFNMHGFRWYLYFDQQNNLFIACHGIPHNTSLYVLYDIYCNQTEISDIMSFTNNRQDNYNSVFDSNAHKISTQKINYKTLKTLYIKLTLIEIYSSYIPISHDYMANDKHYPCKEISAESFTWTVIENPHDYEKYYRLLNGYFRHTLNELIVATDVIRLCLNYLDYFQNPIIRLYKANQCGYFRMNCNHTVNSPIFMLCGFKCYLSISVHVHKNINQILIHLNLATRPTTITELTATFSITCRELNYPPNESVVNMLACFSSSIPLMPHKLQTLNELTFDVNMIVLSVMNSKNESITNFYQHLLNPSMDEITYKYPITIEKRVIQQVLNNEHYYTFFEMFQLQIQCCLKIENKKIYLEINTYNKEITYGIKWRIVVNELNFEKVLYCNYMTMHKCYQSDKNIFITRLDGHGIEILDELNIDVYMIFLDVYGINGDILTTKYCTDDICIQEKEPISTSNIEWRLPSMTLTETELICCGFPKHFINIHIPSEVIELCFMYLFDAYDPISSIQSYYTIKLESNIIQMDMFRWQLCLEMNTDDYEQTTHMILWMRLLSLSPMIDEIYAYLRCDCNMYKHLIGFRLGWDKDNLMSWSHKQMQQLIFVENLESSELSYILSYIQHLTFNVEFALLNVSISNSKKITAPNYIDYQFQSEYLPRRICDYFIWKFHSDLVKSVIKSDIFEMHGFQWQLQLKYNKNCLYTSDDVVEVILLLIAKPEDVHCIQLSWQSEWIEFQKGSDGWLNFSTESKPKFMKCWNSCDKYSKRIFRKDLKTLELNTFRLDLMLCGVYDVNGYCITDKYINFNGESHTIKDWLANQVKLLKYYDIFIKYGVRNMDHVLSLDMDKLNRFGIANINDKVKILREIEKRKHV
eukprot:458455_1